MLAVFALVAANAFFVIAEYALVTSRRGPIEQRAAEGHAGARVALALMDDPVRLIGTVQIGITALGILLGAVGEPVVRELLGDGVPRWVAFVAGFAITTYLSVAFGELVPKALALHDPEPIAAAVARPIHAVGRLTAPAVWILQASAAVVLRPLGIPSVSAGDRPVSREDLLGIVQDAEEAGELGAAEEDMISAIVELRGRPVADVMVPWSSVAVADLSRPASAVAADMANSNHSRLPALASAGGPVVGVLHARDVWRAERAGETELATVARDAVLCRRRRSWTRCSPGCAPSGSTWRSCSTNTARRWASSPSRTSSKRSWARSRTSSTVRAGGSRRSTPVGTAYRAHSRSWTSGG